LKSRGMRVSDENKAKDYLQRIGYYRLSGYWYPFRRMETAKSPEGSIAPVITDQFRDDTEFRHAVDLYVFDKKLRLLFLDALERIEIALRVDVASCLVNSIRLLTATQPCYTAISPKRSTHGRD